MRIGFVGSGKVATAFGRYLALRGETVGGYFDRHADKVARAGTATGGRVCTNMAEVAAVSDLVLITTRDDQIEVACRQLTSTGAVTARHLVGHMSGAHTSLLLADAMAAGAVVFSLHPLQSFADEEKAVSDLPTTWFSLEGADPRIEAIEKVLDRLGNPWFRLTAARKPLYHLSACIFSNYLVTLIDAGLKALKMAGIDQGQGMRSMLPLIEGTIANIVKLGPERALTGPVARADVGTLRRHLDALDEYGDAGFKELYRRLGLKTLELAMRDVLKDKAGADQVRRLLEEE